jgi:hypothetical protein
MGWSRLARRATSEGSGFDEPASFRRLRGSSRTSADAIRAGRRSSWSCEIWRRCHRHRMIEAPSVHVLVHSTARAVFRLVGPQSQHPAARIASSEVVLGEMPSRSARSSFRTPAEECETGDLDGRLHVLNLPPWPCVKPPPVGVRTNCVGSTGRHRSIRFRGHAATGRQGSGFLRGIDRGL